MRIRIILFILQLTKKIVIAQNLAFKVGLILLNHGISLCFLNIFIGLILINRKCF